MAAISAKPGVSAISLAVPVVLLAALSGVFLMKSGLVGNEPATAAMPGPQTVLIAPREFSYRSDGEFSRNGFAVDGPMRTVAMTRPLEIMKYQVSLGEYRQCVDEGVCSAGEMERSGDASLPVIGVNYHDAHAYADWLSQRTGEVWRLPSDEELAFAAGSKFPDDALGVSIDSRNPAERWLADYKREAARKAARVKGPQPLGFFGENEFGLADFGGNVWEWTTTCNRRVNLDGRGTVLNEVESCGIYVTSGKHRAAMSSFVRDPKGGGCSVGVPPDNLGFRLVRDNRWYAPLLRSFAAPAAPQSLPVSSEIP